MSATPIHSVLVKRKIREATDICSFELVAADGGHLPPFTAGSHIDVCVPGGITRQYSLCNCPAETHRYVIGVLRDPSSRGGSIAMHEQVVEGQILQISPPKNHFTLVEDAPRSLLLAGGIGVTPILCMAERLSVLGARFEMHYSTRSLERTAFLERIRSSSLAKHVHFHFDDGAPEQRLDIESLLSAAGVGTHLYFCGPKGFMDAVLRLARAQGWPEAQLHYEFFAGEVMHKTDDGSFDVQLARTGRVIKVGKDETVVEALTKSGVDVPVSCEQGVCGTCLTRVIEGVPDHRDMFLTSEEMARNDCFTPCCSRAKTPRLVLDL